MDGIEESLEEVVSTFTRTMISKTQAMTRRKELTI